MRIAEHLVIPLLFLISFLFLILFSGGSMFLDYFALGVLIFVFLVIFYGIIILHDIPYLIAKKRNHPHADAIHVAGWVSLFTLHVIWPFLWIWATLYRPERGWGMQTTEPGVVQLQERIAGLEKQLADLKSSTAGS
jgi:hypothetical protein